MRTFSSNKEICTKKVCSGKKEAWERTQKQSFSTAFKFIFKSVFNEVSLPLHYNIKKFRNSFPQPKKCFSSPVQKWTWCKDSLGQRSPLISATFRLTCSNQCWMLVSKDLQSCRPTTIWWSATCVWKTNRSYTNVPDWRCQLIKCEVDKNIRKTSADSVLSLFREFS